MTSHLPEFERPPLVEVVLGVQFAPPQHYLQIMAHDVWTAFKAEFPIIQEYPPLLPQFETFGSPEQQIVNFDFGGTTSHPRYWFLKNDQSQLIQFQRDRFLHNWRKTNLNKDIYPRFESIFSSFSDELMTLERTLNSNLKVNQFEISYINLITLNDEDTQVSKWISFMAPNPIRPNDFNVNLQRVIFDANNRPTSRLHVECGSTVFDNHPAISLNFTVRGAPSSPTAASALEFIRDGRNVIADAFLRGTTDSAHEAWGRVL